MKHFIVIDMQNDFCTGALANPDAVAVIPFIKHSLVAAMEEGDNIIFTRDTHTPDYLKSGEGKHLPVEHCLFNSKGWEIVPELANELIGKNVTFIDKIHFGYNGWADHIMEGDEVTICGTVTSICVAANVSAIKMIEGVEVTVLAKGCADLTPENHEAALKVMAAQQAIIS